MNKNKIYALIWDFIKPYKWYFLGMMTTGFVYGAQASLAPYSLKLIIDGIANYSGDKSQIFPIIKIPVIFYVLIFMVSAINHRIQDWLELRAIPGVKQNIYVSLFSHLKKHSYQYFQNNFAGSLLNKIHDMANGSASIIKKLDHTFASVSTLIIAMCTMYLVSPLFSAILFIWSVSFITISLGFYKKIKTLSHEFSSSGTVASGKIVDSITNAINSRLFAQEDFEKNYIQSAVIDTVNKDRLMQSYILKMRIVQDCSIVLLIGGMLAALIIMYTKGLVTIGDFAFVLSVSMSVFGMIWYLASQFVEFAADLGKCAQALSIITDIPHEIIDIDNAPDIYISKGEIEFSNVSFHYNRNNHIFKNKNIIIKPGTKTGLVGFSGSGKTTFVNLILRIFQIESGAIFIDGQNIAKVTQDSLHRSISMIPQDISLFHRSLMDNIRYGNINATDEEVIEASKRAHCHEFISILPEGYHSLVGERGIKLSGGQRQRIAIARAMLKNAPIFILDEATSALDSMTEQHIQNSLDELMQGRTTLIIAHRLSTLLTMETILVFHEGQIIEQGSHTELLDQKGHYAKLWAMQIGGFLPDQEQIL